MSNARLGAVLAVVAVGLIGCGGVGVISFDARNGGPPPGPANAFATYTLDCNDTFAPTGGKTALGNAAGSYSVACTFEGRALEEAFDVLGVFHAAPMASGKWNVYHDKVIAKAQAKGCPGVAVRRAEPTANQEGEAIGAFCVRKKG